MDDTISDSKKSGDNGAAILIIAVVIITIIAVALVPDDNDSADPADKSLAQPTTESTPPVSEKQALAEDNTAVAEKITAEPQTTAEEASVVEQAPAVSSAPARPGDAARELIARVRQYGNIDLGSLYKEAEKQQIQGAREDAYLLYFFAAREGHAESALTLAKHADPRYFDASSSVFDQADASQSYKWYLSAINNGSSEANTEAQSLREKLEADAAQGDESAQRLILQWQ